MKKQPTISAISFLNLFNSACISKDLKTIRFVKSCDFNYYSGRRNTTFGYFELDNEGVIIKCERGYAFHKGKKLINREEAYANDEYKMRNIFTGRFEE